MINDLWYKNAVSLLPTLSPRIWMPMAMGWATLPV